MKTDNARKRCCGRCGRAAWQSASSGLSLRSVEDWTSVECAGPGCAGFLLLGLCSHLLLTYLHTCLPCTVSRRNSVMPVKDPLVRSPVYCVYFTYWFFNTSSRLGLKKGSSYGEYFVFMCSKTLTYKHLHLLKKYLVICFDFFNGKN